MKPKLMVSVDTFQELEAALRAASDATDASYSNLIDDAGYIDIDSRSLDQLGLADGFIIAPVIPGKPSQT